MSGLWGDFRAWWTQRAELSPGNGSDARVLSMQRLRKMMDEGASAPLPLAPPPPPPPIVERTAEESADVEVAELAPECLVALERDVPRFHQELILLGHHMRACERDLYLLVGGALGSASLAVALLAVA